MQATMKGCRYYPWLGMLEDMAILSEEETPDCRDIGYYQQVVNSISERLNIHSPLVSPTNDPDIEGQYSSHTDTIEIAYESPNRLFGIAPLLHEYAHFLTHWSNYYHVKELPCMDSLYNALGDGNWQGGFHGNTFAAFFKLTIDIYRELTELSSLDWDDDFPTGYLLKSLEQDGFARKLLIKVCHNLLIKSLRRVSSFHRNNLRQVPDLVEKLVDYRQVKRLS